VRDEFASQVIQPRTLVTTGGSAHGSSERRGNRLSELPFIFTGCSLSGPGAGGREVGGMPRPSFRGNRSKSSARSCR
jgi:hypothetical protein